jgi:hypothetical protein
MTQAAAGLTSVPLHRTSLSLVISGAPHYADSAAVMCHHLTNHLRESSLTFVRINLFVFDNEFAQHLYQKIHQKLA